MIFFIAQESTRILHLLPFLGDNIGGVAQGLMLSLINPLDNNYDTCLLISSFSCGLSL